jgi:photosynthetic reaction center cytochrome c subunit
MRVARPISISAAVIIFSSAAFVSLRLQAQSTPQPQPAPKLAPKLAEEQFKNIQVLKGIPADQLIPSMQFISASLGVECEYCHVEHANEKDDKKPKLAARKMITMMLAINKDNFEGHREVTCYSCHRGAANPIATPIIAADDAAPRAEGHNAMPEEKPALPAADQLLDKYLAAVGGADALHKITSRIQKGNLIVPGGQPAPIDVYAQAPDKRLSVSHMKTGDSITAFNGQQGWLSIPSRTHIMSAAESDAARIDADFYFAANLKSLYQKFSVAPGEKIDTHDTWLVTARSEGKPPLRLYLDKDSGLLLRLIRYAETPLGRNPTQIDYADYSPADGIKLPFRWTLARPGGNRFTIQIDHLEQNVPIDATKFTPPTPPPQK